MEEVGDQRKCVVGGARLLLRIARSALLEHSLQRDPGTLGQRLHRFPEGQTISLHQPCIDIPKLAAAKATEVLRVAEHRERRGTLRMEGAQRDQSPTARAQGLVLLDQGNQVVAFLDPQLGVLEAIHWGLYRRPNRPGQANGLGIGGSNSDALRRRPVGRIASPDTPRSTTKLHPFRGSICWYNEAISGRQDYPDNRNPAGTADGLQSRRSCLVAMLQIAPERVTTRLNPSHKTATPNGNPDQSPKLRPPSGVAPNQIGPSKTRIVSRYRGRCELWNSPV